MNDYDTMSQPTKGIKNISSHQVSQPSWSLWRIADFGLPNGGQIACGRPRETLFKAVYCAGIASKRPPIVHTHVSKWQNQKKFDSESLSIQVALGSEWQPHQNMSILGKICYIWKFAWFSLLTCYVSNVLKLCKRLGVIENRLYPSFDV